MLYEPYVISTCGINRTAHCQHLSTDPKGNVRCAKLAKVPNDLKIIPGPTITVDCPGVRDFAAIEDSLMKSKAADRIMMNNSNLTA